MNVLKIRNEMRSGKSIYDIPLRVTFYARVSTDKEEQLNSLENQIQYYTELIKSKPHWTYVDGYIDEGISGTSTKKREDFNRMIADAKARKFDFIITKEISRFSRSTLDSILYTQQLLENDVGVLFQNDNINTLDADSEFRLVVMAGVAQDEVRKLSERLKFGFRQAIKNGHVLGNDKLWGYNKKDCILTINEEEARAIRMIFELYANEKLGVRRISQRLLDAGFCSREGNAFNTATIRHVLTNPKYKGWYCANKSQSIDYRSKRKVFLPEEEWVMYPDPSIPAIVSEELWNRANAIYKQRQAAARARGIRYGYNCRYAYSGKIICEEHGTSFHRDILKSSQGDKEIWQCKIYRERGRTACSAPLVRTAELNQIMALIFNQIAVDKKQIINQVVDIIRSVPDEHDYKRDFLRLEGEIETLKAKKDRLLELSIADVISVDEFRKRNIGFNEQMEKLELEKKQVRWEMEKNKKSAEQITAIQKALEEALSFEKNIDSDIVTTILDHIIVKKDSTRERIHLEVHLKFGDLWEATYPYEHTPACDIRLRNITHRPRTSTT